MRRLARPESGRGAARSAAEIIVALVGATVLVGALEVALAFDNASSVYLLAVAAIAIRGGTLPAIVTAVAAFLVYNLLFVEPRITLTVARPEEIVTLLLLLFIGVIIGRLAGIQRDRELLAQRREREARALFAISRELATARRVEEAARLVVDRIRTEAQLERVWIGLGSTIPQERVIADTSPGERPRTDGTYALLQRDREEASASWTRIRPATAGGMPRSRGALYRVELRTPTDAIGSLWCVRPVAFADPEVEQTRLLAAAADQVAQAVGRERLAASVADAELARRSEELRSALLDSVSHDLRTPLATIRAAAGSLADPAIALDATERHALARSIDLEADRMNRLVATLLDMSRIQSGALVPDLDVYPVRDLVEPVVERMRSELSGHPLTVQVPLDLPSVRADATLLTQALTNLIENAVRHTPAGTPIAIRAAAASGRLRLVVEDGGPGVAADELGRLFERFYRGPAAGPRARRGMGLGLTVVQGIVQSMGGAVSVARSSLGGLAVTVDLPLSDVA